MSEAERAGAESPAGEALRAGEALPTAVSAPAGEAGTTAVPDLAGKPGPPATPGPGGQRETAAPDTGAEAGDQPAARGDEQDVSPIPARRVRVDARLLEATLLNLRKRIAAIPLVFDIPGAEDRMCSRYAVSRDGLAWEWQGTVMSGTPGTWDARGARLTAGLSPDAGYVLRYRLHPADYVVLSFSSFSGHRIREVFQPLTVRDGGRAATARSSSWQAPGGGLRNAPTFARRIERWHTSSPVDGTRSLQLGELRRSLRPMLVPGFR